MREKLHQAFEESKEEAIQELKKEYISVLPFLPNFLRRAALLEDLKILDELYEENIERAEELKELESTRDPEFYKAELEDFKKEFEAVVNAREKCIDEIKDINEKLSLVDTTKIEMYIVKEKALDKSFSLPEETGNN